MVSLICRDKPTNLKFAINPSSPKCVLYDLHGIIVAFSQHALHNIRLALGFLGAIRIEVDVGSPKLVDHNLFCLFSAANDSCIFLRPNAG